MLFDARLFNVSHHDEPVKTCFSCVELLNDLWELPSLYQCWRISERSASAPSPYLGRRGSQSAYIDKEQVDFSCDAKVKVKTLGIATEEQIWCRLNLKNKRLCSGGRDQLLHCKTEAQDAAGSSLLLSSFSSSPWLNDCHQRNCQKQNRRRLVLICSVCDKLVDKLEPGLTRGRKRGILMSLLAIVIFNIPIAIN